MRRFLLPVVVLTVLSAAVTAWVGYRALAARSELTAARVSLTSARAALLSQDNAGADRAVAAAGRRTREAVRLTGDPVFRAVASVPKLGSSARVVRIVATTADELARSVLPEAVGTARALDPQRVRRRDGSLDVALLSRTAPRVRALAQRTARLEAKAHALPSQHVLTPIRRGRKEFIGQLRQLSDVASAAARSLEVAPAFLGADRPRTYFVMVQQTSESRGTGGLLGAYAVLTAREGRITVLSQGSNEGLKDGPVRVPPGVSSDYVHLYGVNGAFDIWPNVNLSPDLPTVARVVAARWQRQSGQRVDGVISLDAAALASILRGGSPIDVGDRRVPPDQLPAYMGLDQYRDFQLQSVRKEKLTRISAAAIGRLTTGGGDTSKLLQGLAEAIRSGHLRMASDDQALAPLLRLSGIDGGLPAGKAPVAYPVVFNSSGGKLDYFLDRSVRYVAGACRGRRRQSEIAVELTNRAPASGLPPYVTIFTNGGTTTASTDTAVTLSVYGTRGSDFISAKLDGKPISLAPQEPGGPVLSSGSERGLPVWYVFLVLSREQPRRLVLHLDEPVVAGKPRIVEQPLARPLASSLSVPECR